MNLIVWDFLIKNDIILVANIKKFFIENNVKYLYQPFNINYSLFFIVWQLDVSSVNSFVTELNTISQSKLEKVHISLDNWNNIKILYWDINLILPKDNFISFDIMPNQSEEFILNWLLQNINLQKYKLCIMQKLHFDDFLNKEIVRVILVF